MSARDIVLSGGGSSAPVYVDDVFSTYLYTGNGSTQTITNGIDLAGKGGMVWMKCRSGANPNALFDTVRGGNKLLFTDTNPQGDVTGEGVTSFNANGFSIGNNVNWNQSAQTFASWAFRKQPKFFDIVTYTGDATNPRTIPHSLSSVPGMIIIKRTDAIGSWWVYHNGITVNQYLNLDTTAAVATSASIWGTGLTSTGFTVNAGAINVTGATYVAYIYAHNAGGFGTSGVDNAISCGTFTTNQSITIGFEPQWILYKDIITAGTSWQIIDNMRGMSFTDSARLFPNSSGAEVTGSQWITPTSTGFITSSSFAANTFIYMAIRRPNKPPTSGTQVYSAIARTGTGVANTITGVGFAPDLIHAHRRNGVSSGPPWNDRLRGAISFTTATSTGAESSDSTVISTFNQDGVTVGIGAQVNGSTFTYINHFFKRAPGFFDVVCYTGTGVATTVNHNLGVVPELIIVKARNRSGVYVTGWSVWSTSVVSTYGSSYLLSMNETSPAQANSAIFTTTQPTSTVFSVGTNDSSNASANGNLYVAYLFATLAGISKVGSYTGNGTSQTIACGFSAGARFVLIKRTDSTGDWYIWDSARGIVSANDPHLSLNSTAAEVTTDDSVDPDNSGFIVNQVAATNINVTSATYIFLAIA
jgi:hypothetical protein